MNLISLLKNTFRVVCIEKSNSALQRRDPCNNKVNRRKQNQGVGIDTTEQMQTLQNCGCKRQGRIQATKFKWVGEKQDTLFYKSQCTAEIKYW